jgi:hypothetical protein
MLCCGLAEIDGLDTIKGDSDISRSLKEFCDDHIGMDDDNYDAWSGACRPARRKLQISHFIFSQAYNKEGAFKYGDAFAAFIKKHDLGAVVTTGRVKSNPKYPGEHHKIKAYIWSPNERNLLKWYKENGGK